MSNRRIIEALKKQIREACQEMDNNDYYYAMRELSEWAATEADEAELGWRNGDFDSLMNDD